MRIGAVASARKPPQARTSLQAELSAATTDGSSTTIGHDVFALVDDEVHAETERQPHDADDVLDHLVGGGEIERVAARRQRPEVARR